MNYDETNQEPKSQPPMQSWIEPELEARVVAWVAGEASAFEIAELERLVTEKPELAIFKRRIEAVHGLVAEAARPDKEPLQLAPERRVKLLETLRNADDPGNAATPGVAAVVAMTDVKRKRRRLRRWIFAAAACVPLTGLLFVATVPAFQKVARKEPPAIQRAENADDVVQLSPFVVERRSKLSRIVADAKARVRSMMSPSEEPAAREVAAAQRSAPSARAEADMAMELRSPGAPVRVNGITRPLAQNREAAGAVNRADAPAIAMMDTDTLAVARASESNAGFNSSTVTAGRSVITDSGAVTVGGTSQGAELRFSRDRETTTTTASAAAPASFEDRASGNLVPLRVEYPKPLFAGTPRPFGPIAGSNAGAQSGTQGGGLTLSSTVGSAGERQTFGAQSQAGPIVPAQELAAATFPAPVQRDGAIQLDMFQVSAPTESVALGTVTLGAAGGVAAGAPVDNVGQLEAIAAPLAKDKGSILVAQSKVTASQAETENLKTLAEGSAGEKKRDSDQPLPPRAEPPAATVEETSARTEAVSTFSLHVSDVSFRLAQAALARGEPPEPGRIRPEEFYNAFHYGDPAPAMSDKVGCWIEQAAHPFLQQRNFVRIAMKVPSTGRAGGKPLRLTVLLDTSGSMERPDRAASVRRAMEVLISLLGANDRITLIGFARQPRMLADSIAGNEGGQLLDLIARTPAEGGTNLEEALKLAADHACSRRNDTAQNRVVLLTDGAANLGNAEPASLAKIIERLRENGIAFDACGVGLDGLDDAVLEALTRKGDGRYYVLDSPEAADAGFARQLAGAFRPAAENVKVQVSFNPARVGHYRLIGFDQHRLREEDFRNDAVDAAELAADEAAVAVYQIEPLPQGTGELGEVFVRFRDAATGEMVERSWPMHYDAHARAFDRSTPSMQLAGTAALLAEKLRASPLADQFKLGDLAVVVNALRSHYEHQPRVQELVTMFGQMRRISGE